MKQTLMIMALAIFSITTLQAGNNIVGKWKTIDDESGKVKSIVEIRIENDKAYGTIIKLFNDDPNYDPICDKCNDHLKNKKIIGMQIINDLKLDGDKWEGDNGILDPDNGKYYDCKIWVDEDDSNILNVRGYISFLYRTQTWHRIK